MKSFLVFLFLLTSALSRAEEAVPRLHGEYDPAKWPSVNLVFSQAGTLRNVFDAGLRPYRFPGLENTTLEVKHLDLRVSLASGKTLPGMPAEVVRLTPFVDGEIATLECFTPKLEIEQARKEMVKWIPLAANGRSVRNLDDYLDAVQRDFLDFDDPFRGVPHGCSVNWKEPGWKERGGGPQVITWFRKTASSSHPLRLHLKITWSSNRPIKDSSTFHPGQISPPAGYEHVDMAPPEKFGPDSMVDILRSKGVDIGDGKGGIPYDEYSARANRPNRSLSSPGMVSQPESFSEVSHWWRWSLVLLLVITGVILSVKARRGGR